jgi:hypothetical protein
MDEWRLVLEEPVVGGRAGARVARQNVAVVLRDIGGRNCRKSAKVRAGRLVQPDLGAPFADSGDGPGQVHDRVRLQWNRPMTRDAAGHQLDASGSLFQSLHRGELDFAVYTRVAAGLGEAVLGVELTEMLIPAELGSESNDSRLSCQDASVLFCSISELNDGQTRDAPEMARIDRQHGVAERERGRTDKEIGEWNHDSAALLLRIQLAREPCNVRGQRIDRDR